MKKIFAVLFTLLCLYTKAQKTMLQVLVIDSNSITKTMPFQSEFSSKTVCLNYIEQMLATLKVQGFITASIDTVFEKESLYTIKLFIGNKYTWKNLNLPDELSTTTINTNIIEKIPQNILNYYQNNGYPFVKLSFDSVVINKQNEITASLKIDKGYLYKIDSIRIIGSVNIDNQFLQHYLKLYKQSIFNAQKIAEIDNRINQLPYLSSYKNSDILMLNKGCVINLYLQSKKVNKFDAIIGFLPNNNQTNGKLLFTLDANLNLLNAFAKGESISLNWQQIQPQSPRIDIGFAMPYIFNSKAQLNFNFNLYKRDSAYININTNIGIEYEINNKSRFAISLGSLTTRIIQPDTLQIIATKRLQQVLDFNITNLGFEYFYNNTIGSKVNRRKGFEIRLFTSFGQKNIKPNNTITSLKNGGFNYSSLYDSVQINSYQIKAKIEAAKYFVLNKQSVLKLAANYGIIQTKNYFQNELFQIGGFKLLRGFDEENIFTNEYIVSSVEYRYLIANNSYFFAFSDGGFTKNKSNKNDYSYISGGLGLAFETKQGILNISFAAGKRNDLPFNLRETKIHIGIVSNL
jgi:outer membrane protein assembly factor BamA